MGQQDRDVMMATLRKEALDDAEKMATKQRFALFSQPPSLATGDDKQYEKTHPPRNEDGKPMIPPRNISVGAPKQGKVKDSYFSLMGFTTIGDPFVEQEAVKRKHEVQQKKLISSEVQFKPASGYKNLNTSAYKYEPMDFYKEKSFVDAEGKVITMPPNIRTNPESKFMQKRYSHLPDPYERQRELKILEQQEHKKIMGDRAPFKSTVFGKKNFNNIKKVFGEEGIEIKKRPHSVVKYNIVDHEAPFRPSNPSKKGYNATLQKFPEYKPNPIKQTVRAESAKEREAFKPKHCGELTRPTPTISCNPINIRREIMSGRVRF